MRLFEIAISVLAFVTGMIAAFYWYRSSKVPAYPLWDGDRHVEPGVHSLAQDQSISTLQESASEAARLNKIAALWTAVTVALTAVSSIASTFQ